MSFKDVFKTDLIDVNITVNDEIELFNYASKKLLEKSLVKTGYATALAKREEEFPTGLMTKNFNIAIPHANPENINSPFIYILRLTKPITVKQMADKEKIKVKDVFILGIKDGQKQVNVLAALMNLFVNDAFAKDFLAATTSKEIYSSVIQHLEDD